MSLPSATCLCSCLREWIYCWPWLHLPTHFRIGSCTTNILILQVLQKSYFFHLNIEILWSHGVVPIFLWCPSFGSTFFVYIINGRKVEEDLLVSFICGANWLCLSKLFSVGRNCFHVASLGWTWLCQSWCLWYEKHAYALWWVSSLFLVLREYFLSVCADWCLLIFSLIDYTHCWTL